MLGALMIGDPQSDELTSVRFPLLVLDGFTPLASSSGREPQGAGNVHGVGAGQTVKQSGLSLYFLAPNAHPLPKLLKALLALA